MAYDIYDEAIAEISLSGAVGLGKCSKSTAYRWTKNINQRLATSKCNWSVKLDLEHRCISSCDEPPDKAANRRRARDDQK